jgi:hypothetical protein
MAALDRRHRQAQDRLGQTLQAGLMGALMALPDPDTDQARAAYAAFAVRMVGGAQRRSADLAIGYLARLSPPRVGAPASVTRALTGVTVHPDSPVATSPILRLLARLAQGEEELVARQAAGSYAGALGSGDRQAAERGGLTEGARAGSRPVRGWRKELGPGACDWCIQIASSGGRYRAPETVPFHDRDHCGVAPVFADDQ